MSTVEHDGPEAPLAPALREEIAAILRHAEYKRAAATDALRLVQKHCGFVSDRQLVEVATLLEMSPAELDGVATFYNLIFRRPVGRHVILLCDSVACWLMGETAARAHLRDRSGHSVPVARQPTADSPCCRSSVSVTATTRRP